MPLAIDRADAIAQVTAPGQPFETRTETIRGERFTVFANAPANLRELYRQGLAHADADFYVYEDTRLSFGAIWQDAARVANALVEHGIAPGERVGIAARNYPEWIVAFMGITSMGAVAVALNAWWSGEELVYGIEDSGLKLLFTDIERTERLLPHRNGSLARGGPSRSPTLKALNIVTIRHQQDGLPTWEDFIAGAGTTMPEAPLAPEDNATILYTSGSTAHPKGVLSTHRAITNALLGWECGAAVGMAMNPEMARQMAETPSPYQQSLILSVPLFHVTGLVVQALSAFRFGRKLVGMYKWDVTEAMRIIEAERITTFNGVPTMAAELAQAPDRDRYDLSSLKSAGGGGAPMAPEQSRQVEKAIGKGAAGTGWGMTETQGLATTIGGPALMERPRSCGRAVEPLVHVKAVLPDGTDAAPGETGELWIHGVNNFSEYWNKPEATAEALTDGWVHTGDIGHIDEEGFVFITDRLKDMVLRGGENIGCQEVEAVLYEHPAIMEAAVFGVPDERLGETVAAVVTRNPGMSLSTEDVQAHAAEHLARFKVPEHVWIRSGQLPRIASEKIFKRGLREEAVRKLAAGE